MSLSSSLNAAFAGLDLTSRRADLVARNVANADAPGYARRELEGSGPAGLPGSHLGVSRPVDPRLMQLRREAQSREAGAGVTETFHTALDTAFGDPDRAGSLQAALARLDAAFVSAAASPDQPVRLSEVVHAADAVAATFRSIDAVVQQERQAADTRIDDTVRRLNDDLTLVERLNVDIRRLRSGGNDAADLVDRRTVLVDRISQAIPVREMPRDGGAVALVTDGGLLLLDGRPLSLGFTGRSPITPDMTFPSTLSGLTVNGMSILTAGPASGIRGGSLEALFSVRDTIAPEVTSQLDGLAADLMLRMEATTITPTTPAGTQGLFTDAGMRHDPSASAGLAGRIVLNERVATDRPDTHYRVRDGLDATSPAGGGDSALLLQYGKSLAAHLTPLASGLAMVPADLPGHAAGLRSIVSAARINAADDAAHHKGRAAELVERRDGAGVDIDAEMRRLIDVEQAYAANARVMQAVSDMMRRLTEI